MSRPRHTFHELFAGNPMLIEITRFRRKYFTVTSSNAVNGAMVGIVAICYVGLCLLVLTARGSIDPDAIVIFQTAAFTLFGPALLHGAIAGERERRSWDLLLVAPITKAQIVVGKFMGALAALGTAAALFLVPILLAALTYDRGNVLVPSTGGGTNWYALLVSEMLSLSFSILVCAWTLLLSARVRRGMMALGASIGSLALVLLIGPGILASLLGGDQLSLSLLLFLHPFFVLASVSGSTPGSEFISHSLYGWPQILVYLGLSAVMVSWAINTLYFAENEVKFIPKAKSDA